MRAPNKSRSDAIVREIISGLYDQAMEEFILMGVTLDIRATIAVLRELDREISCGGRAKSRTAIRGKRQENVENFTAILKELKALQRALAKTSGPALVLLFSGEDDVRTEKVPGLSVQRRIERRLRQITGTLSYLRARCDFLLAEHPGEHGSADYRQRRVAQETYLLLRRHKKEPASGIATSLYGRTASLLYEAMTGDYGRNLERACRAALNLAKDGRLADDGIPGGSGTIPLE